MPHSFPGAHHPAIANIIKIVFIKIASAFFATKKIITFPCDQHLSNKEMKYVINTVKKFYLST